MRKYLAYTRWVIGSIILAGSIGIGIYGLANASKYDDDDDDDYQGNESRRQIDSLYAEECGSSCHMAYPPGLLPAVSWQVIMQSLDDHFGENAELSAEDADYLSKYLVNHAADRGDEMLASRLLRHTKDKVPLRITELAYFKDQHHAIPERMVERNPKVQAFSQCDACHPRIDVNGFDEDSVVIPGFGRWDD